MKKAKTLGTVTHTHTHTHVFFTNSKNSLLKIQNCTLANQSVVVLGSEKNKKDKIGNSFKKHIA